MAVNHTQFWGRYGNDQGHPREMPRGHRGFQALESPTISDGTVASPKVFPITGMKPSCIRVQRSVDLKIIAS